MNRRYDDDRPPHGHYSPHRHDPEPPHSSRQDDEGRGRFLNRRSDRGSDTYSPREPRNDGWRRENEEYGPPGGYGRPPPQQPDIHINVGRGEYELDRFGGPRLPRDAPFNAGGDGGPWQEGFPGDAFGGRRESESFGGRRNNDGFDDRRVNAVYGDRHEIEAYGDRRQTGAYGQCPDDAPGAEQHAEEQDDGYRRQSQVSYNAGRENEYDADPMLGGYDRRESEFGGGSKRESAFEGQGYGQEPEGEEYGQRRISEAGGDGEGHGGYESRY